MSVHIHPLRELVMAHKAGEPVGITSVCSAHPVVIETSIRYAARHQMPVCIEATCNQVNQFGGYTGMRPADFAHFIHQMAEKEELPETQLILGGDHLGPHPWRDEPADHAMQKAEQMVVEYVRAGFTKIHLDASMRLGDDNSDQPLAVSTIAGRAAQLCAVAEQTAAELGRAEELVYIIGTEVPIPGGMQGEAEVIQVSTVNDAVETIHTTKQAFEQLGLADAWQRVVALVVHPGVEFKNFDVSPYLREQTKPLSKFIEGNPQFVFEAHSTDYQTETALQQMVNDHFAILKVGPELTFAFREAVYALECIEKEYHPGVAEEDLSNLWEVVEHEMQTQPVHWAAYYLGGDAERTFARKFSYSDRVRYYWPVPTIQAALARLFANLIQVDLPLSLLSQYMPQEYRRVRARELKPTPQELVRAHIELVLFKYWNAIDA
ncbi:MAG: D-tagatose-bisphosphate aldolase, class II, non-catalytic subunit [Anaerolineales bacterium]|nr:D-tagatose-bisphosphate aldolase, class II, non-catalytic subunit [Anaerolineales bacterium]